MKFAVVLQGTCEILRLNDKNKTVLSFDSEVKAHKICRKLNVESQRLLYLRKYEVIRVTREDS